MHDRSSKTDRKAARAALTHKNLMYNRFSDTHTHVFNRPRNPSVCHDSYVQLHAQHFIFPVDVSTFTRISESLSFEEGVCADAAKEACVIRCGWAPQVLGDVFSVRAAR